MARCRNLYERRVDAWPCRRPPGRSQHGRFSASFGGFVYAVRASVTRVQPGSAWRGVTQDALDMSSPALPITPLALADEGSLTI